MDPLAGKPADFYAATGNKPVEGAWYSGQRYMGGQLLAPGQDQPGHDVSADVIAQTAPGNVNYVNQQRQQAGMTPAPQNKQQVLQNDTGNPAFGPTGTGGTPTSTAPAPLDLTMIYNAAMNTPEAKAADKGVGDAQAAIDAENAIYTESKARENNNPFYSASTLSGKISAVDQKHQETLSNLTQTLTNAQNKQAQMRADAQIKVNLAKGTYDIQDQAYQENLTRFNSIVSAGGLLSASPSDLAQYAAATGISYSSLQSIQKKQQQDNVQTQLITSTDNNGNLSIVAVDKNTGKPINTTTLPGAGKSTVGTSDMNTQLKQIELDKAIAPSQAAADAKGGNGQKGMTLGTMMNLYQRYGMSPQQIYDIYRSAGYYKPTDAQQLADQTKYNVQ